MSSPLLCIFSTCIVLCVVINTQEIGYAQNSFSGPDVDVTVQINTATVTIDICGPSNVWFGIGFDSTIMLDTYSIITWTDPNGKTVNVKEYTLGDNDRGNELPKQQITLTSSNIKDGKLCVIITRDTILNTAGYHDFPVTFTSAQTSNVIVAKGNNLDYTASNAGMGSQTSGTLSYIAGVAPSESVSVSRRACFASDSYVLTYPDFERKQIEDLMIYDNILTYDELEDKYVWDKLLVKIHFEEDEYLNDVLVSMREFILSNGERLTMSDNHLLFIGQSGLQRADQVRIGDKLKVYSGSYTDVIGIIENVMKYGRNLITYNGNLVINGIAISTFTDTIWGEPLHWGNMLRNIMKYGYSHDIWRYPVYFAAKMWREYTSFEFKDAVLTFYFDDGETENEGNYKSNWFSWFFSS